ncbi:MAG: hypothetical protein U1F76_18835 [Candidatus Competibacteraceae bacterium]
MLCSNIAIHISWEAVIKLGGIGTALENLITSPAYQEVVSRTILLSPFFPIAFGITQDPFAVLATEGGEVLYSSRDHLEESCYSECFRQVEKDYHVAILYGRRILKRSDEKSGAAEVLLIDLTEAPRRKWWTGFTHQLLEQFRINAAVASSSHYVDYDYNYGIFLAEPAVAALSALLERTQENGLLIAHQSMGLPLLYKTILDRNPRFRTVFYAQECPSARYWIEREGGSDTRFYNLLRQGLAQHKYMENMLGDMTFHGQHRLLSGAHHCDAVIAIGDYVANELRFLNPAFAAKQIDTCYHGVPVLPVTLSEKLYSRGLLQGYAKDLLKRVPEVLMTHITRPARSKALWRDLAVCHVLDRLLGEDNRYGVLFIVSSAHGSRPREVLKRMEAEYGWPRHHCPGYPDLQGEEIPLAGIVDTFNQSHRYVQVVLVNSFGWPEEGGPPTGMTRWDLRRAADVEFGLSMYEPFGISQLEPLCCGAICVISSVSGAATALERICQGHYPDNILLADYIWPMEDRPVEPLRQWTATQQQILENRIAEQLAHELWRRLPVNDVKRQVLLESGQMLARRLSWDRVVREQLQPVLLRLQKR